MLKLLKSDFYKLKKSKAFWICTTLSVVVGVLMVVAFQANIQMDLRLLNPADHDYVQALEMSKHTSAIWGLEQFMPMNFSVLLVGVFIAIFVTAEFAYGTMKNTLSRGADRIKVFFSKLLVCGGAAVVMQLLFIAALLGTGTIVWGFDPTGLATAGNLLGVVLLQLLIILAFTAVFIFISTSIRGGGGAITTNILCATMISTLFSALSMLFGGKIALNNYWLGGIVPKLATVTPASGDVAQGIVVALAWGVVALLVGSLLFKKQDVK